MVHVGNLFTQEREKRGLTIGDVAKATKIRESFLVAIEKGEYHKLPSSAYAAGFVRNYIRFLGLPEEKTLAIFRREFPQDRVNTVLPQGLSDQKRFSPNTRIKLSHGVIFICFLFTAIIVYILFQYKYAFISPPVTLNSPTEMATVSGSSVVVIGNTDPNATVLVNNEAIAVDSDGNFKKTVNTFLGKNTIIIDVKSRFGRETKIERHIDVKPSS